eukprot:TRINITY_DN6621_c0_g1_i1.p1 TRINITY_DN6621_c0_g1~~TRINITY_DN6621_c0_g1_i1.p1  ORF type:complete len:569 (+),score=70.00 TRINITY_DN6621_c0_g1_i1:66-1772(+)
MKALRKKLSIKNMKSKSANTPEYVTLPDVKTIPDAITTWEEMCVKVFPNPQYRRQLGSLQAAVRKHMGDEKFFGELLPKIIKTAKDTPTILDKPIPIVRPKPRPEGDETEDGATSSCYCNEIVLTQKQCLCILANSFLCVWPGRTSFNCLSGEDGTLPSINLDEMFAPLGGPQVAKCRMVLDYFIRQYIRQDELHDPLSRKIVFVRQTAHDVVWEKSDAQLCDVVVHPLRESLDDGHDLLRVDFANAMIGGGAIAYGCVQEEIMFAECPEMCCTRLMFSEMEPDEAILMAGTERFASHKGYAFSLQYDAPHYDTPSPPPPAHAPTQQQPPVSAPAQSAPVDTESDETSEGEPPAESGGQETPKKKKKGVCLVVDPEKEEADKQRAIDKKLAEEEAARKAAEPPPPPKYVNVKDNMLQTYYVAIDATDYRGFGTGKTQFQPALLTRELVKSFAGFHYGSIASIPKQNLPNGVATGNWGCGAFLGDPFLKSILQWLACSQAGHKVYHYYPFDNQPISNELPVLAQQLANNPKVTVGTVLEYLMDSDKVISLYRHHEKTVYHQLMDHFKAQ